MFCIAIFMLSGRAWNGTANSTDLSLIFYLILYADATVNSLPNNHMHLDSKKRRSFRSLLLAASDMCRQSIESK